MVTRQTTRYLSQAIVHQDSVQEISSWAFIWSCCRWDLGWTAEPRGELCKEPCKDWLWGASSGAPPGTLSSLAWVFSSAQSLPQMSPWAIQVSLCPILALTWLHFSSDGCKKFFWGYLGSHQPWLLSLDLCSPGLGTEGFCPDASLLSPSAPGSLPYPCCFLRGSASLMKACTCAPRKPIIPRELMQTYRFIDVFSIFDNTDWQLMIAILKTM